MSSTFSRGQSAVSIGLKGYTGFSKLNWSSENLGRYHKEKGRWDTFGYSFETGYYRNFDEIFFGGVVYDYHRIEFFENGIDFAERCRMHELQLNVGYIRKTHFLFERLKVGKLHVGYTGMSTLGTNPYLIEFSSPYVMRTKWAGWNLGFEFGYVFEFWRSESAFQLVWTYDFIKQRMIRAWTVSNDREIDSSGEMNITNFGVKLTFLFSPGIFERKVPSSE
ncbi:MAG: hypothetical protein ACKVOK_15955 [Flavobacteriales bacterium]